MSRKKLIGIIAAVCIVAALGGAAVIGSRNSSATISTIFGNEKKDEEIPFEEVDGGKAVLEDQETAEGAEDGGAEGAAAEGVAAEGAADAGGNLPDGNEWRKSFSNQGTSAAQGSDSSQEKDETKTANVLSFPYVIPGTNLTIEKISGYDGIFLEDGSDSEVAGITSIVLKNSGENDVEYADITMNGDGEKLNFKVSDIAAGSSVIVQEANKSGYTGGTYADCSADVAQVSKLEMSGDKVRVEENEDGSLAVSNLTGEEIPCVRVFYKFYMKEENAYVGGITYTVKVTNLEANGTREVTPSHYSAGYSKVVMVRTYDTAD